MLFNIIFNNDKYLTIIIKYSLNNVELHIRRGLLVAVVGTFFSFSTLLSALYIHHILIFISTLYFLFIGKVGCGKSTLLMSLLGELHKVYG